jgi:hypothetical protein
MATELPQFPNKTDTNQQMYDKLVDLRKYLVEEKVLQTTPIKLTQNVNLDGIKTQGIYLYSFTTFAGVNCPTNDSYFYLEVIGTGDFCHQNYYSVNGLKYYRKISGSPAVWSDWQQYGMPIYTSNGSLSLMSICSGTTLNYTTTDGFIMVARYCPLARGSFVVERRFKLNATGTYYASWSLRRKGVEIKYGENVLTPSVGVETTVQQEITGVEAGDLIWVYRSFTSASAPTETFVGIFAGAYPVPVIPVMIAGVF